MRQSPWASSVPIKWYISCPLGGSKVQNGETGTQAEFSPAHKTWTEKGMVLLYLPVVIYTFILAPPRTKPDVREGSPSPLWDGAHLAPDVLNGRDYRNVWSLPRRWSGWQDLNLALKSCFECQKGMTAVPVSYPFPVTILSLPGKWLFQAM